MAGPKPDESVSDSISYMSKFHVRGRRFRTKCFKDELLGAIRARMWKKIGFTDSPLDWVFRIKDSHHYFNDYETFEVLFDIFHDDPAAMIEAELVHQKVKEEAGDQLVMPAAMVYPPSSAMTFAPCSFLEELKRPANDSAAERHFVRLQHYRLRHYPSEYFCRKEINFGSWDLTNLEIVAILPEVQFGLQLIGNKEGTIQVRYFRAPDQGMLDYWLNTFRVIVARLAMIRKLRRSIWLPKTTECENLCCVRAGKPPGFGRRKRPDLVQCRMCGKSACSNCSRNKLKLARLHSECEQLSSAPVCKPCFEIYKEHRADLVPAEELAVRFALSDDELERLHKQHDPTKQLYGYLSVKLSKKALGAWNQRWCTLSQHNNGEGGAHIIIYKDKYHQLLGGRARIELVDVVSCRHHKRSRTKFVLETNDDESWSFDAPSPIVSTRWVANVNRLRPAPPGAQGAPRVSQRPDNKRKGRSLAPRKIHEEGHVDMVLTEHQEPSSWWRQKQKPAKVIQNMWLVLDSEDSHLLLYRHRERGITGSQSNPRREIVFEQIEGVSLVEGYSERFCLFLSSPIGLNNLVLSAEQAKFWVEKIKAAWEMSMRRKLGSQPAPPRYQQLRPTSVSPSSNAPPQGSRKQKKHAQNVDASFETERMVLEHAEVKFISSPAAVSPASDHQGGAAAASPVHYGDYEKDSGSDSNSDEYEDEPKPRAQSGKKLSQKKVSAGEATGRAACIKRWQLARRQAGLHKKVSAGEATGRAKASPLGQLSPAKVQQQPKAKADLSAIQHKLGQENREEVVSDSSFSD
eukprot:g42085.t1